MTSKIGRNIRTQQSDLLPLVTLGIAKVEGGYELRKVTLNGTEVQHVKVLSKASDRAEIMQALQMALIQYTINFNEKQMG